MVNYKNFKTYNPGSEKKELIDLGVSFLVSDEGVDWYESQENFGKDTLKIGYDPLTKVIKTVSYDVSSIFPNNMSVGEVSTVPKRFNLNGPFTDFVFNEDKFLIATRVYSAEEKKEKADYKKSQLMAEAMSEITPLQYALNLEMASEQEKDKLNALQKYVVLLNRVSDQQDYPENVEWPEKP